MNTLLVTPSADPAKPLWSVQDREDYYDIGGYSANAEAHLADGSPISLERTFEREPEAFAWANAQNAAAGYPLLELPPHLRPGYVAPPPPSPTPVRSGPPVFGTLLTFTRDDLTGDGVPAFAATIGDMIAAQMDRSATWHIDAMLRE